MKLIKNGLVYTMTKDEAEHLDLLIEGKVFVKVEPHIEPEVKQSKKAFVGKMSFVNIDTLDQYFNDGDTVSLEKLKAMG